MRARTWLTGLGAGTLMLGGVVATQPFAGAAAQSSTPTAQAQQETEDATNATPVVGTPLLQPTIDLAKAQEAALKGQNGAAVTAVQLDGSDGTLVYDVELDNGVEVQIDATTGELLKTERAGNENGGNQDGGNENGGNENGGNENGGNQDGGGQDEGNEDSN